MKTTSNNMLDNERYTYDKLGNRLSSAKQAGVWQYNDADQLLSTPEASYDYTLNGNIQKTTPVDTAQKPTEYIYNTRDRLAEVKKDSTTLQSNRYDFSHRRIVKKTDSHVTYFLYSQSMGLIGKYNRSGKLQQAYGYLPKSSYTTSPQYTLTPKASGIGYDFDFYHNDHLATPQKLTNSMGTVSWAMESNAFGEVTIKTQTTTNDLRFSGQYADSEIGLSQNFFRNYKSNLGRYAEIDPTGLSGDINTFDYSNNSPNKLIDPLGLYDKPGLGDQFNFCGTRGNGKKDYTEFFSNRFPNTINGAIQEFKKRIKKKACQIQFVDRLPPLISGADDIDISNDMKRYGDKPQSWIERNVRIGNFELKTDTVYLNWEIDCKACFTFQTRMYVWENAGQDYLLCLFTERKVRMGEWDFSGGGCCG